MTIDRRAVLLGAAAAAASAASAQAQDRALANTLIEIEINSWQYTKDKNVAAMQSYLANEAVLIFVDGSRFTKAEFLKALPTFRVDSFNVDRKSVEVLTPAPDVACLLYRVTYNPGTGPLTVQSSNTYVRRQGAWQSVLYQETTAKK
jgi:hypothetical protein